MARQKKVELKRHANGLIAVDQDGLNGWILTFNPDDDRLYIHAPDENLTVRTTYASDKRGLENARYWMRKHAVEVAR
jgi:hypothetical protein